MSITTFNLVVLLSLSTILSGCIGIPVSEDGGDIEISGEIDGVKSNPDEKVIAVRRIHGTRWVFTPEGTRQNMTDGESLDYYLDKNGVRIALLLTKNATQWDHFVNIHNQWFAFNMNADSHHFQVVQFDSFGNNEEHTIRAYPTGTITDMYFDKTTESLIWKQKGNGYQQYDLVRKTKKRINQSFSASDIERLVKIPNIKAAYDDIGFFDALKDDEVTDRSRRAVFEATSGYSLLQLAETESVEWLRKASLEVWYMARWAVALNPNTPREIIEKLADDSSFYVANEARKRVTPTTVDESIDGD